MATTVVFAFRVTEQLAPVVLVHPVQFEKLFPPDVAGAVRATAEPAL